ncbi:predicted protein [Uncinocarpus reesii 1704]|uniref:F-box domain-containing protein n=1 Tax=Uncinocarpus reesii (strain UAMH 1704) TaxID=336963 RepID=C4JZX8_UNCRE|nr:uncharacterized protein UREG_07729 [Uncinocarpus reesii 1704]EEP82864.1 predicted protein [Uncinocarpus reesii 1704]
MPGSSLPPDFINSLKVPASSNTEVGCEAEDDDGPAQTTSKLVEDGSVGSSTQAKSNVDKELGRQVSVVSKERKLARSKLTLVALVKRLAAINRPLSKQEVVKTGNTKPSLNLLDMPMDILVIVLDNLEFADVEILRYVCRTFYYNIEPLHLHPMLHGRCMIVKVFRRLYSSSLLPNVREGDRLLTKDEIKEKLQVACPLCLYVWPHGSRLRCPFHEPMEYAAPPPIFSPRKPWNYFRPSHFRWAKAVRTRRTQETYERFLIEGIESDLRSVRPRAVRPGIDPYPGEYSRSWLRYLKVIEDFRATIGTYYGKEFIVKSFWGVKRVTQPEIFKLYCCNHCRELLPMNNPGRMCRNCYCGFCGTTVLEILRVIKDQRAVFVPLGILVDETIGKADEKQKKLKTKEGN